MAERKIRLEWRPDVYGGYEAESGPASATILGAEAVLRAVRDVFAQEARGACREAAQIIVAAIGAPGPEYVGQTARRAVTLIAELIEERDDWKLRYEATLHRWSEETDAVQELPASAAKDAETIAGLDPARMSEGERSAYFDRLRGTYCIHCGSDDPRCQCWNDE